MWSSKCCFSFLFYITVVLFQKKDPVHFCLTVRLAKVDKKLGLINIQNTLFAH